MALERIDLDSQIAHLQAMPMYHVHDSGSRDVIGVYPSQGSSIRV